MLQFYENKEDRKKPDLYPYCLLVFAVLFDILHVRQD
jgi:hypothetical protein